MRKFSKFLGLLLSAVMGTTLMCGCKLRPKFPELPESADAITQTTYIIETPPVFEPPAIEAKHYSFDEIENISDEELIGLADYAKWHYPQNLFIEDYFDPLDGEYFDKKLVPEGADLDEYCREERHYRMYRESDHSEFINRSLELFEDNDVFSAWLGTYTEVYEKQGYPKNAIARENYVLFMKNFSEDGTRYTGEMTADDIKRNFDVLTYENSLESKICRRVVETENSFVYESYSVSYTYGECAISLIGKTLSISKEDGLFHADEQDDNYWFYRRCGEIITYLRTCKIPDSAPKQP